jgi:hypothetical protein
MNEKDDNLNLPGQQVSHKERYNLQGYPTYFTKENI